MMDRSAMMDPAAMRKLNKKKFTNKEMKFDLTKWRNLPPPAKRACRDLGYTQTKWDDAEQVDASWEHWWDLTDKQLGRGGLGKQVSIVGLE